MEAVSEFGWGGRIRTYECRIQRPVPYHLATPQYQVSISERDNRIPQGPNAWQYSRREMVVAGKIRQPASACNSFAARSCESLFSKIPKTLEPLPASSEPIAPTSSRAFFTRSISGSDSKITSSKSLCRDHRSASCKSAPARELERIESPLVLVKAGALRVRYASIVATAALGLTISSCVF